MAAAKYRRCEGETLTSCSRKAIRKWEGVPMCAKHWYRHYRWGENIVHRPHGAIKRREAREKALEKLAKGQENDD